MAAFEKGRYIHPLAAVASAGGVAAVPNPEGVRVYVKRVLIDITTQTSGACTLDAGIAANATTLSDTLIDGASAASVATLDNGKDGGTNGKLGQVWGPTQYVTVSQASGAIAGIVGNLIIEYVIL